MTDLAFFDLPDAFDDLARVLRAWLPRQRWFAGKARDFADLRLHDAVLLTAPEEADLVLEVLVDAVYADGHSERYQVPLAASEPGGAGWVGAVGGVGLVDATFVPAAARLLTSLAQSPVERLTARGDVLFGEPLVEGDVPGDEARRLAAEQSNTSMVLGGAAILKLFRRLEPGENPEVELTRALTQAGFANAPRQRGSFGIRHRDGSVTALAVLADFVAGGREGWTVATAEVDRVTSGQGGPTLLDQLGELGRAVADMHGALAEALGTRAATAEDLAAWAEAMRRQCEEVLATAQRRAPETTAELLARRDEVIGRFERLADEKATGPLTRTHGDLHLGQVLLDPAGRWVLLDFEGEPAKSLDERRQLTAPLRDTAGMLRSFDYAAAAGSGGDLTAVPPAAAAWRDEARHRFLDGYLAEAAARDVLPEEDASVRLQLDAFELDKAVYELGYELANRPDWVPIPIGGITRILDRSPS